MEHTGQAYNNIAAKYADSREDKPINVYYERPGFCSLLPPLEGLAVLDAGCGPGWFAEYCQKNGAAITAFDYNQDFVERTRARLQTAALDASSDVFQEDLAQPLNRLSDSAFDLVICSLVLHYLEDWLPALREFHRVLKPDGRLVFSTHHPAHDWIGFGTHSYFDVELLEDEWDIGKVQFYRRPITKICADLNAAGFLIEQLLEPQPLPEWKDVEPESYERFNKAPWRLMIRACKA